MELDNNIGWIRGREFLVQNSLFSAGTQQKKMEKVNAASHPLFSLINLIKFYKMAMLVSPSDIPIIRLQFETNVYTISHLLPLSYYTKLKWRVKRDCLLIYFLVFTKILLPVTFKLF